MAHQEDLARRFSEALSSAAINEDTWAVAAQELLHPDIEYHEDPRWPGATVYRGVPAVVACFASYRDVMGRATLDLTSVEEVDGWALATFDVAVMPHGSAPVPQEWSYLMRFEDGLLREWRAFVDRADALQAARDTG